MAAPQVRFPVHLDSAQAELPRKPEQDLKDETDPADKECNKSHLLVPEHETDHRETH
jgi:hypothetical protein